MRFTQRVKMNCKQRVCRFSLPVSRPFLIFAAFKMRIIEVYTAPGVTNRRQNHHTRAGASRYQQWPDACCHLEMAQMIGGELAFKSARIAGQRAGHDCGVVDEDVDLAYVAGQFQCKRIDGGWVGQVHLQDGDITCHAF